MAQSKFWCFTINNPINDDFINMDYEYLVYQNEVGENGGVFHIQGYICYINGKRLSTIKADFQRICGQNPHFETRKGTHEEAKNYCMKEDTRIDGPYEFGDDKDIILNNDDKGKRNDLIDIKEAIEKGMKWIDIQDKWFSQSIRYEKGIKAYINQYEEMEYTTLMQSEKITQSLKDFQRQVIEIVPTIKKGEVLWIYSLTGQEGKSYIGEYLECFNGAFVVSNKKSVDINYIYNKEEIIVFDYARSNEDKISYQQLEEYADGRIISTKYDVMKKRRFNPKTVVFANWLPKVKNLSLSRWKIYEITDELQLERRDAYQISERQEIEAEAENRLKNPLNISSNRTYRD
nr:MAG: replication associated protein [Cressdnaviricota sp.]